MGLFYLVLLVGVVSVCFFITGKALGDAENMTGFSFGRFIVQAVLAGVPGVICLSTLGTSNHPTALVITFFVVAAIIHILYCRKLFGTGRGIAVAFCSMVSAFIIVILVFFALDKIRESFRSFAGKGSKNK